MSASRPCVSLITSLFVFIALLPAAAVPVRASVPSLDGIWSSLDAGVPAPSARREYAAIYDAPRNRYIIFGGFGFEAPDSGGLFDEVWTLSLGSTPEWSPLVIAGPSPGERHSPQWGYDPARQRLIVFGGYGHHYPGAPNEYLNDIWELSLDGEPAWTELTPAGTPPSGRLAGASVYDPLRQRFVGFGGTIGVPVDSWSLDLSGDPKWSTIETDTVSPPGGYGMTTIYDPVRDRMLIFGGSTSDDYFGVHNDVWALALSGTPAWTKLAPLGTAPAARRSLTSIYDPVRDRMIVFGGWDGASNATTSFLGDAWALSLSEELRWAPLAPGGGAPIGRDAMAAVYDPGADRMVVFGGWSGDTMLGDTWFLGWGESPTGATLTASAQADQGIARLRWEVQHPNGTHAAVYRRGPGTPWSSVATVESDAAGAVSYEDRTVAAGGRYAYQLVVPSRRGEVVGGEVWVDVPSVVGVTPAPQVAFTLNPVQPNPLVDRFVVSFALASAEAARLDLLDLSGRRLRSREVGSLGAGGHQVELGSARDFRPGMYFVRLSQSGQALTRRVVIGGRAAAGR